MRERADHVVGLAAVWVGCKDTDWGLEGEGYHHGHAGSHRLVRMAGVHWVGRWDSKVAVCVAAGS